MKIATKKEAVLPFGSMHYVKGLQDGLEFGRQWKLVEHFITNLLKKIQKYNHHPFETKVRSLLNQHKHLYNDLKQTVNHKNLKLHFCQLKLHKKLYKDLFAKHIKCKCILKKNK